jgi:hypothetical protein
VFSLWQKKALTEKQTHKVLKTWILGPDYLQPKCTMPLIASSCGYPRHRVGFLQGKPYTSCYIPYQKIMYILGIRVPDLFIFLLDNNFSPKKLNAS